MTEALHDKGYKRLFSNKVIFRQLIESFVLEDWVQNCDFSQCQRVDKSFVSEHYKETESDLIYQVKFKGSSNAYIFLLTEFQATAPWYMAIRMLNYVGNFYMDWLRDNPQKQDLPPIFPLVLYNGNPKWTAATDFASLLGANHILGKYTPQLHYCLIDESQYDLENLRQMGNLVSTLIIAERCTDIATINQAFLALYDKYDPLGSEEKQPFMDLLNWFIQLILREKVSGDGYQELVNTIYDSKEKVANVLTETLAKYGQNFYVKGREEGLQEGLQKGRQEALLNAARKLLSSMDDVAIAEITGLPAATIAELRRTC
ncbi:Rpn family recombination-promoting nuclease/putative transposase [Methylovulum psychrotolerans]|uniref:Transposase n=1 Tax=Methylovulum psychrotolerans TaxID=1704499 RepID=A0A2S5CSI0_9GAMM|nr:Rpn family recombination-promoting nuclease/putative transposase [Methylovulum psychrotolerans]POZ53692.1 transposase [Methylovulum psychrotolerans]